MYFFIVLQPSFLLLGACNNSEARHSIEEIKGKAEFKFDSELYDFGEVLNGDTVSHVFAFSNVGTEPLIINDISTSCGCTVANWSKKPVMVGERGFVHVKFSKRHDPGLHQKIFVVKANTKDPYTVLKILAKVSN